MVYLYYWDGKLVTAPTKLNSESELVQRLNRWNYKIAATNGRTNCINRVKKLVAKNKKEDPEKDYHILTNSVGLVDYVLYNYETGVQCLFVRDDEHWKMITSETVRKAAVRDGKSWREEFSFDNEENRQ